MHSQSIITTSDAINALGGTKAVSQLTGASQQAVSNWRRQPTLPSTKVLIMRAELERRGFEAPLSLWGIEQDGAAS